MKKSLKKILSIVLSALLFSSMLVIGSTVSAADPVEDDDEYHIYNDGYGYLTANFPSEYPEEYIQDPDDLTDDEIWEKVEAVLNTLTLDEKIDMLAGGGESGYSYGTGTWRGAARVGIPVMRFYDGPMGVRGNTGDETTRPPSEVAITSSFDVDAAYQYGTLYAEENRMNNGNMQLGDQVDIIRQLSTSRARDMFGEDWYLSGTIATAVTEGLQDGNVIACLKHLGGFGNIDEQTMHETYLTGVEMAMMDGGAGAVMTNYNSVNGITACANTYILKNILRGMWGYQSIVLTDWGGNYEFTTDNGVTMETPSGGKNNAESINNALDSGLLTLEDIDEALSYNLYACAKAGYFGMVQISRDGTAAVDSTPPAYIELPGKTGEEREEVLVENNEEAIELAKKSATLLMNEDDVLPLTEDDNVALIGFGATNLIAGHQHECSFGQLKGLSVSPYDAFVSDYSNYNVSAYTAQDIIGEPIPAEYLYQDEDATTNGVVRTGTDGYGEQNDGIDANIDFVTNSTTYKNAEDGTAFEYGTQGANYTWTTYLKAPESGDYTIKVEGIAATTIKGTITIENAETSELEEKGIAAAGGDTGVGTYGNKSAVCSDTGLDIPATGTSGGGGGFPGFPGGGGFPGFPGGGGFPGFPGGGSSNPTTSEFTLEAGKVYKVTVSANGAYSESRSYQAGKKDMQVRLAWITPSQKTSNYDDAIEAAGTPDTKVVLFAYSLERLSIDDTQSKLLTEAIAAAKAAGNQIVLVLNTALPVDISEWVGDLDGLVEMWLPGQGGGTATAAILTGDYNPSGRLCVAWPSDFSADQAEVITTGRGLIEGQTSGGPGGGVSNSEVKEGIFNGYKWYDAADKQDKVLFDFGYGLSYSTFDYELVGIEPAATGVDDYGYDVTVKVTNTGDVAGSDVPQVYIGAADLENGVYSPYDVADSWRYVDAEGNETDDYNAANYFPEIDGVQMADVQIVAYAQTGVLQPGESKEVTMHVDQRALAYWDVSLSDEEMYQRADGTQDKWTVPEGERSFYIAKSSDDLLIEEVVDVAPAEYEGDVTVSAQASADEDEVFKIDVTTGDDVIGLKLVNEAGKAITIKDLSINESEGKIVWNVYTSIGTAGDRVISVLTKTYDGWSEEPAASFEISIEKPDVEVYSAEFASNIVEVNAPVDVTVESSSSAKYIKSYNESGMNMGLRTVSRTVNDDGSLTWVFSMSFGSKGLGKIYDFRAIGNDGEFGVAAARAAINVI